MFNLKCIKCGNEYKDKEDDAYLCKDCLNEKNIIAKELDNKFKTVGQQPNSDWQSLQKGEKLMNGQIWLPSKRLR